MKTRRIEVEDHEYPIADLYFAAYLKTAEVPFIRTVKDKNRVYFVFEKIPTIDDLRNQYFNRTAKVPAMNYADEIKAMKALTHM